MPADPDYLRDHFSSLSDEALLTIERSDLTDVAQSCYDAEVRGRGLAPRSGAGTDRGPRSFPALPDVTGEDQTPDEGDKPVWLEEAAEVYSVVDLPHRHEEERMADARHSLDAAGIPCYLELVELTAEEKAPVLATHRWRLMAPAKLSLRAVSTLQRDLSNPDFEDGWKTHLEACSNDELPAMHPRVVFCDLFDRIERATKAYEEELARRGLEAGQP